MNAALHKAIKQMDPLLREAGFEVGELRYGGKVYIVGGGVFGQVIAAKLRKEGHSVTVFDRGEVEAGSRPSGGHIKPSWISSLPRKELDASLQTLDELFGVETLQCKAGIGKLSKTIELLRVDVEKILEAPVIAANVTAVGDGWLEVVGKWDVSKRELRLAPTERLQGKMVIVAAGVWSKQLLPRVCTDLTGKKGIAWVFTGGKKVDNLIHPWAPYKQVVRTAHGPGRTWIGDGSAILPDNWTDKKEGEIEARIMKFAPPEYKRLDRLRGLRPYMDEGFQRLAGKLWLATGGAKSGTAMAGVAANEIAEALR